MTKLGHACVRFEAGGRVVVVDPGGFTAPGAVEGADAVLVTHEHPDHWTADHLRATDAPVYAAGAVAERLREEAPDVAERLHTVMPGEAVQLGLPPFEVRAVGELHAVIHSELPRIANTGYVITADGTSVHHPGDALVPPGGPVDVLCLPVSAPWLKASEAVDFAREVGAPLSLAIHDRVYSEAGLGLVDSHLRRFLEPRGQEYTRLGDGEDLPG